MLDKLLERQVLLGLGKAHIWMALGASIFFITCFISLPHMALLLGGVVASLSVAVMVFAMVMIDGIKKNLVWIPIFVSYHFVIEYATENSLDIIQLAGLTVAIFPCLGIIMLRYAQYINVKRNFPDYIDGSLLRYITYPRYGAGFTAESSAKEAINTILRIRKGNQKAADVFMEALEPVQEYFSTNVVTLEKFRGIVTNSNLKVTEKQFDSIFSYEPTSFVCKIFGKQAKVQETKKQREDFKKGDRVRCPTKPEWGIGEVLINGDNQLIWVYFVDGGVKRFSVRHAKLEKISGKEAMHPGLNNLKFSKAELGITEYFGVADFVKKNSRPAKLLTKVYDDTGSLSFFGGKPIAPSGFEWPKSEHYGKQRCMHFLAQIDLRHPQFSDIEGIPTDGILYFFIDENVYEGMRTSQTVFYVKDGLEDLHVAEQDDEPSLAVEGAGGWGVQSFTYADGVKHHNFSTHYYPKFEIRMSDFSDIRHPYNVYSDCMFEIGRKRFDELEKKVKNKELENIQQALSDMLGREIAQESMSEADLRTIRLLDPEIVSPDIHVRDREPGVSQIAERWPQTWLHVSSWLSDRNYFSPERGYIHQAPNAEIKRKFLEGCEKLVCKAEQKGPFTPISESERRTIRRWASGMFLKSMQVWQQKPGEDEQKAAYQIWSFLQFSINRSIYYATPRCLDLNQSNRDLLNEDEKAQYRSTFELLRKEHLHQKHQMFGYGTNVQNAAEEHIDKVLLLQLYSDGAMSWMFGDVGAVQYWISKDDLKNKRFDKVIVTLEGG